jgi:hypothetical protein
MSGEGIEMSNETQVAAAQPATAGVIIAKPGRYYRVARYLMCLLLLAYGVWSIYDGFISWPKWGITTHLNEERKTSTDIMLNKVLGIVLPPTGLFILFWAMYNSRGQYRLENGILHVPGSPPVPLNKIHSVNRELWDRKGIAYVEYDLTEVPQPSAARPAKPGAPVAYAPVAYASAGKKGPRGKFKIDDFVYEREPTDEIFKAIEESLLKGHEQPPPKSPTATPPPPPPTMKIPPRPTRT